MQGLDEIISLQGSPWFVVRHFGSAVNINQSSWICVISLGDHSTKCHERALVRVPI